MYALKAGFVKLTNSDTWENAMEKFPLYATEAKLSRFLECNMKKGIPMPFHDFCHQAKISEAGNATSESELLLSFDVDDGPPVTANLIQGKLTDITELMIQRTQPFFNGVDIAVVLIDEVCSYIYK